MISKPDDLPSDLVSALAALQAEREARLRAEAVAASARAELSDNEALIAHLELRIEKLKRELYGQRSGPCRTRVTAHRSRATRSRFDPRCRCRARGEARRDVCARARQNAVQGFALPWCSPNLSQSTGAKGLGSTRRRHTVPRAAARTMW